MNRTWWIFRKEVREMFRDKRVRTGAFVTPVLIILVIIQLIGMLTQNVSKPEKQSFAVIGQVTDEVTKKLLTGLAKNLIVVKDEAEGLKLLQKGKVKLVIEPKEKLGVSSAKLLAIFDPTDPLSGIALSLVRESIGEINKRAVTEVLKSQNLPLSVAEAIHLDAKEAAQPKGLGGSALTGMLPYFIVLWAFFGGMNIAGDLVAGEKERGTMETLLVSPVTRREVAIGKFFALAIVCVCSSLMCLGAVVVSGILKLGYSKVLFPTGLAISSSSILAMILCLLPLVLLFAGILLSVSAIARNTREAQTYLASTSIMVLMPAMFSQFIGFTGMQNAPWIKFIPILGNALGLREALLDKTDWPGVLSTFTVCTVLASILLICSIRLFQKETILART